MLKKFAEAFEIATDKLLYDEKEIEPGLLLHDKELLRQFMEVEKLNEEDKTMIKRLIQTVVVKNHLCDLAKSA